MFFKGTILLFTCLVFVSTIPITVYHNARFEPTYASSFLSSLSFIPTLNTCQCYCYDNSLCITGTFVGVNQICVLFGAQLIQGQLKMMTNSLASVFSFPNRTNTTYLTNTPAIIEWLFDGNFEDVYGLYDGNLVDNNGTLWKSPGYAGYGSAVCFLSRNYSLVEQYLDLSTTSFTITAWIWIPFNITMNNNYFALFSHCQSNNEDHCLHTVLVNDTIYFGFFGDDLPGQTRVNTSQWYHVAYVYNRSASTQLVYLNGNLDGNRTSSNPYAGNTSQIILGPLPTFGGNEFHNGFIGKITFVSRVKNSSELLDEATLVAYYPFDGSYLDFGPNNINNSTSMSVMFDSAGRFNQALIINSTNSSYFQITGFYYLGQTNYSYSFTLWIYPFVNTGTILQVSYSNSWCMQMIGFNSNGYLTIQTLGQRGVYTTSWISQILPLNQWIHVSMTYSIINGIRLFVNGSLVNSNNTFNDYLASGQMNSIIVGTSSPANACTVNQMNIISSQFRGKIDELKIFSRELSNEDIIQHMNSN